MRDFSLFVRMMREDTVGAKEIGEKILLGCPARGEMSLLSLKRSIGDQEQ
jgi:hypothetical protein